jgi:hypothetical protein
MLKSDSARRCDREGVLLRQPDASALPGRLDRGDPTLVALGFGTHGESGGLAELEHVRSRIGVASIAKIG